MLVGVWVDVLLGETKVHDKHHLVLLHAGPRNTNQMVEKIDLDL